MRKHRGLLAAGVALSIGAALMQPEATFGAATGWESTVGLGVYGANVYPGSDGHYLAPLPMMRTSYTRGNASLSVSLLDGLEVAYFSPAHRVFASVTLAYGQERNSREYSVVGFDREHDASTKRLLSGTPEANTPVSVGTSVGMVTPIGLMEAGVAYHPTTVAYENGTRERFDGLIVSLSVTAGMPLARHTSLAVQAGVDFMNEDYAAGWYTTKKPTAALAAFEAGAGVRDAQLSFQLTRMLSERVGVSLIGSGAFLLGDARQSPYTVDSVQPTTALYTFYTF